MSSEEPETPRSYHADSETPWGCQAILWILGGVSALALLVAFLMPATQQARPAAKRSTCKNNLKQIGLALHNYHETYGCFPPVYIADGEGKPMHSWRVLLLPYLDQLPLYEQYRFDEPWDGPNNRNLWDRIPAVYRCPSHAEVSEDKQQTPYVTVRDPQSLFPGSEPKKLKDAKDGTSYTAAVVEVSHQTVHWMSPEDVSRLDYLADMVESSGPHHHTGGSHILMGDGAVRYFPADSLGVLESLITRDGGETVGDF